MDIHKLTISEVKDLLQNTHIVSEDLLNALRRDNRKGIQVLLKNIIENRKSLEEKMIMQKNYYNMKREFGLKVILI